MIRYEENTQNILNYILRNSPEAVALISGSPRFPEISGSFTLYQTMSGVLAVSEVFNLPYSEEPCSPSVFGMHIHALGLCLPGADNSYPGAGEHYNPGNCPHPEHAGDLQPLFSSRGYAWNVFLTARFNVTDVIGRTVIIHRNRDDFTTQPSGNSGEKIACGVIEPFSF